MVRSSDIQRQLEWSDLSDQHGNPLKMGAEVQYAIGSKIKTGMCIEPQWHVPKKRGPRKLKAGLDNAPDGLEEEYFDDSPDGDTEGDDDEEEETMEPMPGVLIYNRAAKHRKNLIRACEDICILTTE